MSSKEDQKTRCAWCSSDPLYIKYHDQEWAVPQYDDRALFELLILEGAQAGLLWITVLKKRENYRTAFDYFDVQKVALYDEDKIKSLLNNPGIIRNKRKVQSAIKNAQVFISIQKEFGSFSAYLWEFVNNKPIINRFSSEKEVPTSTPLSETISKDLKNRGMSFVGSTIIYAYLQSTGLVNNHTKNCFLCKEK